MNLFNFWRRSTTERIIVYTAITGEYDLPPEIAPEPGVEYWLFTDDPKLPAPEFWKRAQLANPDGLSLRRLSRLPKLRPHLHLPPHTISIYLDASTQVLRPIARFAVKCVKKCPLAAHPHPVRQCLYLEAEKCLKKNLDDVETITQQMRRYRDAGFPANFGLTENRFLVRRNIEAVTRFNEHWHAEYFRGSQRDQLSFMYSVWSTGVPLQVISQNARRNRFYEFRPHLGKTGASAFHPPS